MRSITIERVVNPQCLYPGNSGFYDYLIRIEGKGRFIKVNQATVDFVQGRPVEDFLYKIVAEDAEGTLRKEGLTEEEINYIFTKFKEIEV